MKISMVIGLLIIMSALLVSGQGIKAPAIQVSLLNQDPDPIGPGNYVDLRFKIYNSEGNTVAKNFQVKLEPAYPFSLDPGDDPITVLGDLPGEANGKNIAVAKYKVRVADNAVQGPNLIKLAYKIDNGQWFSQGFNVDIQVIDANIAIVSVDTTPQSINPGEQAIIKITVKNMASSSLKDVTMKLDLTFSNILGQRTTISAIDTITAYNALPFAPIGSSTEQKIYSLGPNEEKIFTYNLIAYPTAASQVYKIPLIITYYDELNTLYSKNDLIGVVVGAQPDISVLVDSTDITTGKKAGKVTIKFVNKGVTGIKFLNIRLDPTNDFEVTSANEVYLGSIDSDDYETAEFSMYLKNSGNAITLPVKAQFRDANNNLFDETYNLNLRVLSEQETGTAKGPGIGLYIVIILIVAAAYFIIRRRKKAR